MQYIDIISGSNDSDQQVCSSEPSRQNLDDMVKSSSFNQMNHHHHTNEFPKKSSYFGPGVWLVIHTMAIDAVTDEKITDFIDWLGMMLNRLPCPKCVKHATTYLYNHDPNIYRRTKNSNGKLVGMFIWTWIFHNSVNQRLGKDMYEFDEAYEMYLPKDVSNNGITHVDGITDSNSCGEVCSLR